MHKVGGTSFSFVKATEGTDYVNPNWSSDLASLSAHKLIRGSYHFARPGGGTSSQITANATAQANFFLSATGTLAGPGNLPPTLDFEDAGGLNPSQLTLWAQTWLNRVATVTGRNPILYTYPNFWTTKTGNSTRFAGYPLWLASYGSSSPAMVGGWKRYTFWQYTDAGRLTGSSRPVDMSVFNGTLAQLNAMTAPPSASSKKSNKAGSPPAASPSAASPSAASPSAALPSAASPPAALMTQMTVRYTTRVRVAPSRFAQKARQADRKRAQLVTSRNERTSLRLFGLEGSHSAVGR